MNRPTSIGIGYAVTRDAEDRIGAPWLSKGNYPSMIGHPCERYLVLCRTRGDERTKHGPDTQMLFDEGSNVHEPDVINRLNRVGYEVYKKQSRLPKRMWELYRISGYVDAEILVPPRVREDLSLPDCGLVPAEIKGLGWNNYSYLTQADDVAQAMLNAPAGQWYLRKYLGQILVYMYGLDKPYGVFVFKNKGNGAITDRTIWYEDHEDYLEGLLQRCERINAMVDAGEVPPRIQEWTICERCDARAICLPENTDAERVELIGGVEPLLERRDELLAQKRPVESEVKALNKEIARRLDAVPEEKDTALMGTWRAKRKSNGGWTYKRAAGEVME